MMKVRPARPCHVIGVVALRALLQIRLIVRAYLEVMRAIVHLIAVLGAARVQFRHLDIDVSVTDGIVGLNRIAARVVYLTTLHVVLLLSFERLKRLILLL